MASKSSARKPDVGARRLDLPRRFNDTSRDDDWRRQSLIGRVIAVVVLLVVAAGVAGLWAKEQREIPVVEFSGLPEVFGRRAVADVVARTGGWAGLRRMEVRLLSGGKSFPLVSRSFPAVSWLGSGVGEMQLHVDLDLREAGVQEGRAQIECVVETYSSHLFTPRQRVFDHPVTVDQTPPGIELVSTQHNIRLGGVSVAVFRTTPDVARLGVAVGDYFFPALLGYFSDPNAALVIFAVPQDQPSTVRPQIQATDRAGNVRAVVLPVQIKDRQFPERPFNIDDEFLARKVPDLETANGLPAHNDLLEGYLYINRELRGQSEQRLRQLVAKSEPRPLWSGGFRRQSSAASMSAFADRRVYLYQGRAVDRQTHLGFDLASLKGAVIEAAENGVVLFAGNLGIYGGTVVLDHGLGVSTVYGHLRSISVQQGDRVQEGQGVGQSGETGLAGGDHLHFSVMVHGVHVDPVEWWDPHWIKDQVTAKLSLLPAASPAEAPPSDAPEGGADAQT